MPRLEEITIENYRSFGSDPITIQFPKNISDHKIEKSEFYDLS